MLDARGSAVIIAGMNTKILIVDDEKDLLEIMSMNLEQQGFIVRTALSGTEAENMLLSEPPDLILMDVMLGDMSGINLTAKIKNNPETSGIPVIMLSAKDSETDVVVGLSVGADDYITKPFSTRILIARIEAVLKRSVGPSEKTLVIGPLKLIPGARQVLVEGKNVDMTGAEFEIVQALVRAGGGIVSRADLMTILGSESQGQKERIVDVHVASIRKKLGLNKSLIKTVHGMGYRINI